MEFENRFSVKATVDDVWDTLLDVERVAPCLPGAKVLERTGEDEYVVAMRVKVGPISMEYKGNVEILAKDAVARRAVLHASGRELRGQGAAEAEVEMVLIEEGEETVATIKTDVKLSGRAASMGQGVIAEVSKKLVDTFSTNLARMLAPPAAAPAPDPSNPAPTTAPAAAPAPFVPDDDASLPVLSVVGSIVIGRLRSPRVAGAAIAALVALVLWLRRR